MLSPARAPVRFRGRASAAVRRAARRTVTASAFQVAGGADSENRYLVEGQDTANVIGGYSHTDVPFEFVNQVEVKSSGIEAEHGGAMGGVVNVILKRGSNNWHGSAGAEYSANAMNANQNSPFLYYDPTDNGDAAWAGSAGADSISSMQIAIATCSRISLLADRSCAIVCGSTWEWIRSSHRWDGQLNFGSANNNAGVQSFSRISRRTSRLRAWTPPSPIS